MRNSDELLDDKINSYYEIEIHTFSKHLKKSRLDSNEFRNNYLRNLSDNLSRLYANYPLPNIPFGIQSLYDADKSLTYIESVKRYCKLNKLKFQTILEYEAKRKALNKTYDEIKEQTEFVDLNIDESRSFTLVRKILTIKYLTDQSDEKSDSYNAQQNQIKISEFIESLVSQKPHIKGVKNTRIYQLAKKVYSSTYKPSDDDLEFIKGNFMKVGMNRICHKIEQDLKQVKESKNI